MLKDLGVLGQSWQALFYASRRPNYQSAWHGHVSFMHWLVAALKPDVFVELGTEYGVSFTAACHSSVLNGLKTKCFAIDTWQGDAHTGSYDESIYSDISDFVGKYYSSFATLMRMRFDEAITSFEDGSIDLLHIDGLHTYSAVRQDFETWLPKMSARGVILFHDTTVRAGDFGVWRLWEELSTKYPTFSFVHSAGLGVMSVNENVCIELRSLFSQSEQSSDLLRQVFSVSSDVSRKLGRMEAIETTR